MKNLNFDQVELTDDLPSQAPECAAAIQGQWGGSEMRNPWVRDALWAEDRTGSTP